MKSTTVLYRSTIGQLTKTSKMLQNYSLNSHPIVISLLADYFIIIKLLCHVSAGPCLELSRA